MGWAFTRVHIMDDNIWNDCNSLRYGFDESYDAPDFDEDSEDEENE